jgi:hypothetical protein
MYTSIYIYVAGNIDNPVFYKIPRHYIKCQKSLGNIYNTSFACVGIMYNANRGVVNMKKTNEIGHRLLLTVLIAHHKCAFTI